ncbi:MAG: shikimate dehydrogenase family protein, partial [Acidimicrobiales bacterium]
MNPGGPSAATTVAAVIGTPVRHSRSPAIHNAAFAATGLDWTCVAFEVADGDAAGALGAMRVLGLGGLSVTMPHKEAVVAAVDEASDEVRALGAANCGVAVGGDRLRAENTDA